MSHFVEIKPSDVEINDLEALRLAAREMGFELIPNAAPRGYFTGEICDYVLRLKGPYDVGLKRNAQGGYNIVADWYQGYVAKEVGEKAGTLLQRYVAQKIYLEARRRGFNVNKQNKEDGLVQLVLRR